ncbi:hypothetical protein RIF29_15661 [Crotalaria pallida]|uniref:Secreted protein n=1 Tax=Crotalaria pallida TaxID=3830 RepID=A0AAN9FF73_CROPI
MGSQYGLRTLLWMFLSLMFRLHLWTLESGDWSSSSSSSSSTLLLHSDGTAETKRADGLICDCEQTLVFFAASLLPPPPFLFPV